MRLYDYIQKHYNGNVSGFAELQNMKRQQVATCVEKDNYHIIEVEGGLKLIQAKRDIIT